MRATARKRRAGLDSAMSTQDHQSNPPHKPFDQTMPRVYRYRLPGGWEVIAGKTDEDNDLLSLRVAGQNDWWFHVRGVPGSHVILRSETGEEPGRDIRKRAAAIAAFHSKSRDAGVVPVACTRARYVSKPRGAKPGTVHIRKEIILKVRAGLPADAERV
jgi:predicted ribosome quality control (RQC) complex YloA/Tae2 family protein